MKEELDDDDAGACSSGSTTESSVCSYGSNPRASRNMAEKQRRDNLNTQIATMASLVPTVSSGGSRKKDKISVLRLTAAHLRIAYTLGLTTNEFLPRQFNDIDLENCLIDNLAGNSSFLLVVTTTGKIIYISRHVEQHLGHEQIDLIGDSLYNYVYREDHNELTKGLTPDESCLGTGNSDSLEDSSNSSEDSTTRPEYSNFREQRRSFNIRMSQRTNSRRESVQYEYLQISGVLRLANECRNQEANNSRPRRENSSTNNDIIFVGTARLLKKRTVAELSLLEANKNEYFTRHLVDGRIIFCDHRISIVAGYMSEEVSGSSAFKFMHKDDVRWTIVALRHMYAHGKNYGSSCYRLLTKTGEFIYLRTHGYLEFDEATQSVVSFICINTLTSQEEGEELIAEMKKRFSATISSSVKAIHGTDNGFESESECSSTNRGEENVEDLSILEAEITHLVSDLPSPVINEELQSPSPLPNAQLVKAAIYSQRLPPAAIQASKIGIKDIENTWSYSKKGGKGKPSPTGKKNVDESVTNHGKKNGERTKPLAEKKIRELEDPTSPVSTSRVVPIAEKAFPSSTPSDPETYPEPVRLEERLEIPYVSTNNATACTGPSEVSTPFNVQTNIVTGYVEPEMQTENNSRQVNLKRPYNGTQNTDDVSPKKRTVEDCVTLELVSVNDPVTCVNEELDFPTYIQVQPMTLETNIQEVQNNYRQFDGNTIAVTTTENQFIDFQDLQDDQLLNNAIESNPEIIKLFGSIPETITLEGTSEEANGHQYLTSDGAVVENDTRHAHLQMADSMSSCGSHFSDIDEPNIQTQCDNVTQAHSEHKTQKQKIKGLQLNV